MMAKQLSFADEARKKVRRGVDTLAEAVKVTRLAPPNAAPIATAAPTAPATPMAGGESPAL